MENKLIPSRTDGYETHFIREAGITIPDDNNPDEIVVTVIHPITKLPTRMILSKAEWYKYSCFMEGKYISRNKL